MNLINCHTHLFTVRSAPDGLFGPRIIMRLLSNRVLRRGIFLFATWIGHRFRTNRFDRLAAFAGIGSLETQEDIFNLLQGYYPASSTFIVLPMDFTFMGAGPSKQPYLDQLGELRQLKRDPVIGPRIHPFVAIDPRRNGFLALAQDLIENHGFSGIKLYPALGFFPNDDRLLPLWEWAEALQIPIMTHCSRGGVYFRGDPNDIQWPGHVRIDTSFLTPNSSWTDHLSDPVRFRPVFKQFPKLKVCFAHLGGDGECRQWLSEPWPSHLAETNWLSVILGLVKEYPNVYTDISYTGYDRDLHALLQVLVRDEQIGNRVLFGSDFYMVQQAITEREFSIRIRSALTEADFQKISEINPRQYLFQS